MQTCANDNPIANTDTEIVAEDSEDNVFDVLANDTDGVDEGETLTIVASSISNPANGTAGERRGGNDGRTLCTPDADDSGGNPINDHISDGNCDEHTHTVTKTRT